MDGDLAEIQSLVRDGRIHQYILLNSRINNQKPADQTNYRRIDVASVPGLLPA
jgi:hypothetical protein